MKYIKKLFIGILAYMAIFLLCYVINIFREQVIVVAVAGLCFYFIYTVGNAISRHLEDE